MEDNNNGLKASPHQYYCIELLAYWEGGINTTRLAQFFPRTRQQSSKVINRYLQTHPDNLHYDQHQKRYLPSQTFRAGFINGDVSQYLNWIDGHRTDSSAVEHPPLTDTALSLPQRHVSPTIMRALIQAMREQRRVDVGYVSITNPDQDGRIIVPHTFVKTGLRWHLRAYDEKRGEFRDFVLSRFQGTPDLLDKSPHTADTDTAWQTEIELIFVPDSRLSDAQKRVIENDYQMSNGQLVMRCRAALAHYLLQQMQVPLKFLDVKPEAQQLVLQNYDAIKPWLFN